MRMRFSFLKKIINSESPESSKRFFALWGMLLITVIVFYTLIKGKADIAIINMFYALIGLILTLAGVATGQEVWKHISDNKVTKE